MIFHAHLQLINCVSILGPASLDRLFSASWDLRDKLICAIVAAIAVDERRLLVTSTTDSQDGSCGKGRVEIYSCFQSLIARLRLSPSASTT